MASSCNGGGIVDAALIQKGFISILACLLFGVLRESKSNPVNTSNTTAYSLELSSPNYTNWLGDYEFSNNDSIESVSKTNEKLDQSTCLTSLDDVQMFNITTSQNEIEISTNKTYSYVKTSTVGYNQKSISECNTNIIVTDNEICDNVTTTTRTQEEVKTFKNLVDVLPINSSSQLREILNINHSKNDYSIILWKNKEMVKIFVKSSAKGLKPYYFRLNQNNNNSYMLNNLMKSLNNVQKKINDMNIANGSNYKNYPKTTNPSKSPLKHLKKRCIEEKLELSDGELTNNFTDKNNSKIEYYEKLNRKSRSNSKNNRLDEYYNSEGYDFYDAEIDEGLVPKSSDDNEIENESKSKGTRKTSKSQKRKKRKKSKSKKSPRNIRTPASSSMKNEIIFEVTPESTQPEDIIIYDETGVQKPSIITKRDQADNFNNSDILMLIKSFVDNELFPESNNASPEKKVVIGHDTADPFKFDEAQDDHTSSPVTSPLHFNIYFYNNRDRSEGVKMKKSHDSKTTVAIDVRAIPGDGKDTKQSNVDDEFTDDNPARKTEYSNSRSANEPMVVKSGCNLKTIVLAVMIALIVAAILLIIGYVLFKHLKKKVSECQADVSECSTCNR